MKRAMSPADSHEICATGELDA